VEAEPHNFYITALLRTGVLGALALIVLYVGLLRRLWRVPSNAGDGLLSPGVFPALLVTQLVWFLTWIPGNEQGIITGLALALAVEPSRTRREAPSSPAARHGRQLAAAKVARGVTRNRGSGP
jgi:O-antigen ligase